MKKLIEVSLPLEAINKEAAREKSIRHGHPSTLHLWWARRPLAACRAVLFSSLVDDPSEYMPDEESARVERERLFRILEELVKWENSNNDEVLDAARLEIARTVARNLGVDMPIGREAIREFLATKAPPVLDPFAGGGSIPLEAQRLGLRAYASDLNPVAVLINKALIEIPPKFANMPPVHPDASALSGATRQGSAVEGPVQKKRGKKKESQPELWQREWKGAQGLAEDVRYYGQWMRDEAFKRIGHLYPPVTITGEILTERPDLKEQGYKPGDQLTVIAWLWARTVKCPNPACGAEMPLVRSFVISKKSGKEFWANPVYKNGQLFFEIKAGKISIRDGTVNRNGAYCISCGTSVQLEYIRAEGQADRINSRMMAMVAEGSKERIVLSPLQAHDTETLDIDPAWKPIEELQGKCRVSVPLYGMNTFSDLFTSRQLILLTTLCELANNVREIVSQHLVDQLKGEPRTEYINAIITYLGIVVSKTSVFHNVISRWRPGENKSAPAFGRQAIPMVWDYAEVNPFAGAGGDFLGVLDGATKVIESLATRSFGEARQVDATRSIQNNLNIVISTDPPYYDNIEYADLSDFFYVWLRPILSKIYPELFGTLLTPKTQELVASPFRFTTSEQAQKFFEDGLEAVFRNFRSIQTPDHVLTVYYAFKQTETDEDEDEKSTISVASTGWETLLEGMLRSGFCITGTWPSRTEGETRLIARGSNALASSIVLVCRPRPDNAKSCSRREFLSSLKKELAPALRELQQGSIAPVDLAQASIGPGMAVYSRYRAVLEADGTPMSVRTALGLINQALDEYLTEQEGEYDSDTRWALSWFEQFGHNEAAYGVAETLSKAKNTSVNGLVEAGILEARAGKVRLLKRDELDTDWDPSADKRLTAWEACQHLIYALDNHGEEAAAALLGKLGPIAEPARDLAYRLYTVCERKSWSQDALGYNMLVVAWPRLKELSARKVEPSQGKLM